jgi:hypothetical protein
MPVISTFHGIIIRMYTLDNQHHSLPHLHARHAEFEASISIEDGEVLAGEISRKPLRLVQAWVELHRDELMACWHLAVAGQKPFRIDPL